MPTWTKEQLNDYQARRETSGAKPKPIVRHALAGAGARSEKDAACFVVRITSCRVRLVDVDALVGKYLVDALRYAGLLSSDSAGALDYQIRQVKVASKSDERTEIEIATQQ